MTNNEGDEDAADKGIVFHYTNGDGLLGILRSKGIRCTHIRYLNDSREYVQAIDELRAMLSELVPGRAPSPRIADHARLALARINDTSDSLADFSRRPLYVSSFSRHRDDLSQWRAYGGIGPRFSIGFRIERLQKYVADLRSRGQSRWECFFESVLYSGTSTTKLLTAKFIRQAKQLDRLHGTSQPVDRMRHGAIWIGADHFFRGIAPRLKAAAFEREEEYRLCLGPSAEFELDFRPGHSYIVPFVLAGILEEKDVIASVTVGPTAHPTEAKASTESLLRKFGSLFLDATPSVYSTKVPYRDW